MHVQRVPVRIRQLEVDRTKSLVADVLQIGRLDITVSRLNKTKIDSQRDTQKHIVSAVRVESREIRQIRAANENLRYTRDRDDPAGPADVRRAAGRRVENLIQRFRVGDCELPDGFDAFQRRIVVNNDPPSICLSDTEFLRRRRIRA